MSEGILRQQKFASLCLDSMEKKGFNSFQATVSAVEKHELSAEFGTTNLLRTNHNVAVQLSGIVAGRRGSVSLNKLDENSLMESIDELWEIAGSSIPDVANAISEYQPAQKFQRGPTAPDYDTMVNRLSEMLEYTQTTYPTVNLQSVIVDFVQQRSVIVNSNGVDFQSSRSHYDGQLMFTAKEGKKVSSFNYTGFASENLDTPLYKQATTDALLHQITEQINTQKVPAHFEGDLLVTPDCLATFLSFLTNQISDMAMIAGNSLYRDQLDETVTAGALTLQSRPLDMPAGYFVTADGYAAENMTLIAQGELKSYLLSLYGANKLNLSHSLNSGGCYSVDPGHHDLSEMIRGMSRGLLITRFSGGRPNDKGDFSGVAKNSYYIEDGEVRFPVAETMINGNMADLLKNIRGISKQRADFGYAIYPWVQMGPVNIS